MSKKARRFQQNQRKERYEQSFAKKSFGQNFLQDDGVLSKIIEAADLSADQTVLEIGPGLGALTEYLLKTGCHLRAVELDERAIAHLSKKYKDLDHFQLEAGSVLDQPLDEQFNGEWKVVANIPYHITNPILRKLYDETQNAPVRSVLMVQKEVAEKICNSKKGSLLRMSVEIYATSQIVCTVPRTAFIPAPKVDSAVIQIDLRPEPLIDTDIKEAFFTVLGIGFRQKRKKIVNAFEATFGDDTSEILGDIDPTIRAEALNIDQWREISLRYKAWKSRQ